MSMGGTTKAGPRVWGIGCRVSGGRGVLRKRESLRLMGGLEA